jgi:hypothetical protein
VFDVRKAEQRAPVEDESRREARRGAKALGEGARSAGDYDYIRSARGRLIDAGDRPAATRRGMQRVWFRARVCLEWRRQLEREQSQRRASWCNELLLTRIQLSASRAWANGRTTRHEASGIAVDGALLSAEGMQLDCGSLAVPRATHNTGTSKCPLQWVGRRHVRTAAGMHCCC